MTRKKLSSKTRQTNKAAAFKQEVKRWAEKIHVAPQQVRIQRMKNKWASCSTQGWICFSEDLLLQPQRFQEYAIIHELLHLQVPNHGKLFKSLLRAYMPNWEQIVKDIPQRIV
jgi:hypothetical protein